MNSELQTDIIAAHVALDEALNPIDSWPPSDYIGFAKDGEAVASRLCVMAMGVPGLLADPKSLEEHRKRLQQEKGCTDERIEHMRRITEARQRLAGLRIAAGELQSPDLLMADSLLWQRNKTAPQQAMYILDAMRQGSWNVRLVPARRLQRAMAHASTIVLAGNVDAWHGVYVYDAEGESWSTDEKKIARWQIVCDCLRKMPMLHDAVAADLEGVVNSKQGSDQPKP
ncbi:MAG TPA: hypothetical protein VJ836_00565 [Candidatus Saccharimonadales bacterium]|nr:hypothetical protein [Candidatus Saccharimonadales bacterium]